MIWIIREAMTAFALIAFASMLLLAVGYFEGMLR